MTFDELLEAYGDEISPEMWADLKSKYPNIEEADIDIGQDEKSMNAGLSGNYDAREKWGPPPEETGFGDMSADIIAELEGALGDAGKMKEELLAEKAAKEASEAKDAAEAVEAAKAGTPEPEKSASGGASVVEAITEEKPKRERGPKVTVTQMNEGANPIAKGKARTVTTVGSDQTVGGGTHFVDMNQKPPPKPPKAPKPKSSFPWGIIPHLGGSLVSMIGNMGGVNSEHFGKTGVDDLANTLHGLGTHMNYSSSNSEIAKIANDMLSKVGSMDADDRDKVFLLIHLIDAARHREGQGALRGRNYGRF
jgi:hypothetical protein